MLVSSSGYRTTIRAVHPDGLWAERQSLGGRNNSNHDGAKSQSVPELQAHKRQPLRRDRRAGPLDWSQAELADAAVGIVTLRQFEVGGHEPRRATLDVITRAFESAGVEFIDQNGGGPGGAAKKRTAKKPYLLRAECTRSFLTK